MSQKTRAHHGVKVSETNAETTTAVETVIANVAKQAPDDATLSSSGMNTAITTN